MPARSWRERKRKRRSMKKHFPASKDCINIGWWLLHHPLLIFDDGKSSSLGRGVSKTAFSRHQSYLPFSCLSSCWENCFTVTVFSVYGLQRLMYLNNVKHLNLRVQNVHSATDVEELISISTSFDSTVKGWLAIWLVDSKATKFNVSSFLCVLLATETLFTLASGLTKEACVALWLFDK